VSAFGMLGHAFTKGQRRTPRVVQNRQKGGVRGTYHEERRLTNYKTGEIRFPRKKRRSQESTRNLGNFRQEKENDWGERPVVGDGKKDGGGPFPGNLIGQGGKRYQFPESFSEEAVSAESGGRKGLHFSSMGGRVRVKKGNRRVLFLGEVMSKQLEKKQGSKS